MRRHASPTTSRGVAGDRAVAMDGGAALRRPSYSLTLRSPPAQPDSPGMRKLQSQGVHHTTIVVARPARASIDFWEGVLGMPFVLEQPNLGKPDNENQSPLLRSRATGACSRCSPTRSGRTRRDPALTATARGCVEHLAFNVIAGHVRSGSVGRRVEHGIEFLERLRSRLHGLDLLPGPQRDEDRARVLQVRDSRRLYRAVDVLIDRATTPRRARRPPHHR